MLEVYELLLCYVTNYSTLMKPNATLTEIDRVTNGKYGTTISVYNYIIVNIQQV